MQLLLYKDGNDHLGWHSNEELPAPAAIALVSLMNKPDEVRRFSLRSQKKLERYDVALGHGDVLFMYGSSLQTDWVHTLHKEGTKKNTRERISLSFRSV